MKTTRTILVTLATLALTTASNAGLSLITNGGFESGLSGWTTANQLGSEGTFFHQSGATSPVNALTVQPPPEGSFAAMTDAGGPGSHVLYQDFVVPANITDASLTFSLFINNTATAFTTPSHLDFATTALNQQARVDIMTAASDPFSTAPTDILQTLFQTTVGSPLTTGYNSLTFDLTAFLAARPGQTLRLRFAEVDNVNIFNFGVDDVSLVVPSPATLFIGAPMLFVRRRR